MEIKLLDNEFVSARELYRWLELNPVHYARWVKQEIVNNPYAEKNVDYWVFRTNSEIVRSAVVRNEQTAENGFFTNNGEKAENSRLSPTTSQGRPTTDYKLTIPFAKKLCMTSKSTRGEEVRNYFIKVETALKEMVYGGKELNRVRQLLIASDVCPWQKLFPDEYYYHICRLWNIPRKTPTSAVCRKAHFKVCIFTVTVWR